MNPPMAIVREIVKKGIKNLRLVSGPTSGIETDILIGAGCVKEVVTACVAFEKISEKLFSTKYEQLGKREKKVANHLAERTH